ncbi:GHMP kinase [Pontibacterium granulatum]|uniref:mevalonate kinase family protein n=1 Tax=Pontibacterium granulatum TaxID=2036029 RepID=UPI00249A9544|nr:GHMP kinase [Pontibacterium granulatum]MDI3323345.1 GHMP kinase [Pontibacterium granulatum]
MHVASEIKVSAPGSIMLMGEHAVLFGHRALACAVDKYMHVSLQPRDDRDVVIDSALANYHSSLDQLADDDRLSFVLAAIRRFQSQLPSGFTLSIRSEFSHTVGLGSSAAVTAAVVAAIMAFATGEQPGKEQLFDQALAVVHEVQDGRGSGTDLVASVYGGLIAYTVKPRQIEALTGIPPISLYYAGYKTRTPDVLKIVEARSASQSQIYTDLYKLMHQTTVAAESAIAAQDWRELGKLMDIYQGLMDALGVCDKTIADMIWRLRGSDQIDGVKISGSGLGDCVIALGRDATLEMPYEEIPVAVSAKGVEVNYA